MFKYWNSVLSIISILLDLIRADRTGDATLHISTLKKALPIFQIMDRVNYTKWAPGYLNELLDIKEKLPLVFQKIEEGCLTFKHNSIPFTSVNNDQALEQNINKYSKGPAGIKGDINNKEGTTAWELTFHELLGNSNLFKNVTMVDVDQDEEYLVHHEFSETHRDNSEKPVQQILQFLEERKANPFLLQSQPLRNIATDKLVHPETAANIMNLLPTAIDNHKRFLNERFIMKEKTLNARITLYNFPSFDTLP